MVNESIQSTVFPITRFRHICANWFSTIALILLIIALVLFIWMWTQAFINGVIPNISWGEHAGNHGPWRHIYNLRNLWWYIDYALFLSFKLALSSYFFKRDNKAAVIVFAAFVFGFIFMSTYWLVD